MSKYEAVYFVGDNQAINRVRVDSYKTRNRGAFSGSLAALADSTGILFDKPSQELHNPCIRYGDLSKLAINLL